MLLPVSFGQSNQLHGKDEKDEMEKEEQEEAEEKKAAGWFIFFVFSS